MEEFVSLHFKKGDNVFVEGDVADGVYLIMSGSVEILKRRGNEEVRLATQGVNTIFGEMAIIDKKPRSATVKAVQNTICYKLSAMDFIKRLYKIDPYVRNVCQDLAMTIRAHNEFPPGSGVSKGELSLEELKWIKKQDPDARVKTKAEIIKDEKLQNLIEGLDPFMKALVRVLMRTAFE